MPSRSKRIAAAALVALAAAAAACSLTTSLDGYTCSPETCTDAAPDTDGLGDGHMGDKHVIAQEAVNAYAALANDVAAGAATIGLAADRTITAGDLLLGWQTISEEKASGGTSIARGAQAGRVATARTSWSSARAWSARASDGRVGGIIAVLTRGGVGGQGGRDHDGNGVGREAGGLGGRGGVSAVTFLANDRLVIGGGGGAGDRHDPTVTTGGNGGGVIFLRAHDLDVGGSIRADGTAPVKTTPHDGAGGGGAGGTPARTVAGSASRVQLISARGGVSEP